MTSRKIGTAEEVWATIDALGKAQQRTEEARRKEEQDLREALRESHRKTEESLRQTQKEVRELNQALKEEGGKFKNKWGHFLDNLFEDDLVKLLNQQNIKVEEVFQRLVVKRSGVVTGDYDLVAVNEEEVVVF